MWVVHAQGSCAGVVRRGHAQGSCAGVMRRGHAQGSCAGHQPEARCTAESRESHSPPEAARAIQTRFCERGGRAGTTLGKWYLTHSKPSTFFARGTESALKSRSDAGEGAFAPSTEPAGRAGDRRLAWRHPIENEPPPAADRLGFSAGRQRRCRIGDDAVRRCSHVPGCGISAMLSALLIDDEKPPTNDCGSS